MQGKMYTNPAPPQLSDSNRRIIDPNGSSLRVYKVWKGNNRFCLGGRLIFGPDLRSIFLTVSLIVIPVILFCAFVSQRLINEFQHYLGNLIVAICVLFTIYVIVLLFLTSGRDPGIIPRNPHPPEVEDDDGSGLSADWPGSQNGGPSLPPIKEVMVNGIVVKRNYRFFFMFVSSTTLLCLYVFAFCWVNIRKIMNAHDCDLWRAFLKSPVSGILILYTFVAAWFVGGLTAFHLYLIITNQTTYENFRYRYDGKMNPYNRGCARNIMDIFFSKIPSSRNNFRAKVKGGSSSVFTTSMPLGRAMSPEMPKRSFDIETGKRQAVAAEDFEDIQSQIESVGGLERCGTQPRHANWDHKVNWEISPDIRMFAADFETEHGLTERQKINGGL
uniref:S-acyltransferase n=1 Tax=Fagus sylvatica TaxID=28930 RepID=A0A2N9FV60_FAGSY